MNAAPTPLRAGDVVRIRDERWRIVSQSAHGDTSVVEAAGCDAGNRSSRARFLLPFEPIDRLPAAPAPRLVRPRRWRRFARRVLADATPAWASLRAAAHADLTLIPFQLEPALALIRGEGCRFLIADAVGLGKTVQAGLMIAEVLARRPDARVLVISPAALREQWHHELATRFGLEAAVLDAAGVARLAADLPAGINPWAVRRIIVTSIDYIKRPEVMRSLEALTWDFVAFDEAHNLAGRSDRAAAAQAVGRRSRAVALLTATPHSGDDKAFQRLCIIGDMNDADRKGPRRNEECPRPCSGYPLLMFRRTRADAGIAVSRRTTLLRVRPTAAEAAMHAALMAYARRAWVESAFSTNVGSRSAPTSQHWPGARLAMTVLTRRACSSAGSLARSVERRLALLEDAPLDDAQLHLPFADASADDEEPGACLGSRGLHDAAEERARLEEILVLARAAAADESKLAFLRRFLRRVSEPAIIFTEYRDTLERLAAALAGIDAVQLPLQLHGGLVSRDRLDALARFTSGGARLLLATDAASEGLNLHHRCRLVINLELPWTPVRLDQRAGRVDRIGQRRRVHAIRLVAAGTCEESVLARLAVRTDRMRDALGATPDEQRVAASVLGAEPLPTGVSADLHYREASRGACPEPSRGVASTDLRREAAEEAERLARAKAWLQSADDYPQARPAITRLRAHGIRSHQCVWAFRVAMASASEQIVWETIVAATAGLAVPPERAAWATRAILRARHELLSLVREEHARQVDLLRDALRQPIALWIRRELDLMTVMRDDHARMSAPLLQGALFDRRSDRAAASQAALLEEALSHCHARLQELRACDHVRAERCDLAFAVMRE
jgi:superfamily II DNA or RNA helicase